MWSELSGESVLVREIRRKFKLKLELRESG